MSGNASLLDSLLSLSDGERAKQIQSLSPKEAEALYYDWPGMWARRTQLPPPDPWAIWLVLTGRGWGKTRVGAEWIRTKVESGGCRRVALVGETAADARDVMVEGESGVLAVSTPNFRPTYEPTKRRLVWPNGAIGTTYSADDPDQLRGPQHDAAWCDEIAKWRRGQKTWDNLMLGLRLGLNPQVVATSTPKPVALVRKLVKEQGCIVTHGHTYENLANLSPLFRQQVVARYEGTRLGRQELKGELLEDVPGALWTRANLEATRVNTAPDMVRIVVAVDPAVSSDEGASETGILACGKGVDGHGYVLRDVSGHYTPKEWSQRATWVYRELRADRIVGEKNNGGEMVEHTVKTAYRSAAYKEVYASRGKRVRAEPIAALYEQLRIHHVGPYDELEDQMCNWVPDSDEASPDRMDAVVWAFTELFLGDDHSGEAPVPVRFG